MIFTLGIFLLNDELYKVNRAIAKNKRQRHPLSGKNRDK